MPDRRGLRKACAMGAFVLGAMLVAPAPVAATPWPGAVPAPSGVAALLHQAFLAGSCRLAVVDSIELEDGGRRLGWYLSIAGPRPFANADVFVEPSHAKNGDLVLEVVACWKNLLVLPIRTPYVLSLPLREFPSARHVRIVGANGTVRRRLP